jgi:hypothetical protein
MLSGGRPDRVGDDNPSTPIENRQPDPLNGRFAVSHEARFCAAEVADVDLLVLQMRRADKVIE